jgi:hypothetical protein
VLKADDPDKFQRDYIEFPAQALTSVPPRIRSIVLEDAGTPVGRPQDTLNKFYAALEAQLADERSSAKREADTTIELPNHLSGAVKFLITDAAAWAKTRNLRGNALDDFFRSLTRAIRFEFSAPCGANSASPNRLRIRETVDAPGAAAPPGLLSKLPPDTLVVRRQVLLSAPTLAELIRDVRSPASKPNPSVGLFADSLAEEQELGPSLAAFRDANYRRY